MGDSRSPSQGPWGMNVWWRGLSWRSCSPLLRLPRHFSLMVVKKGYTILGIHSPQSFLKIDQSGFLYNPKICWPQNTCFPTLLLFLQTWIKQQLCIHKLDCWMEVPTCCGRRGYGASSRFSFPAWNDSAHCYKVGGEGGGLATRAYHPSAL